MHSASPDEAYSGGQWHSSWGPGGVFSGKGVGGMDSLLAVLGMWLTNMADSYPEPQFPCVYSGNEESSFLPGQLCGSNEVVEVRGLFASEVLCGWSREVTAVGGELRLFRPPRHSGALGPWRPRNPLVV